MLINELQAKADNLKDFEHDDDVMALFHAAMFASLGDKTQLSRSGFNIVFKPEFRTGKADLSQIQQFAKQQLNHAGIDYHGVTQAQFDAYVSWRIALDEQRRKAGARILITGRFTAFDGGGYGSCSPFNAVKFIDGLGELVAREQVQCLSKYDPEAINQIHQKGAFRSVPNYDEIDTIIARLRIEHPLFADVAIDDNNGGRMSDAKI